MAFCSNCGKQLTDGAKFCAACGTAISNEEVKNQRKTVFEGNIHKCPNCGDILNSLTANCPSCGYEIRDISNSNAIQKFTVKIDTAKSPQEKATIIRNFPIPNTKEDIWEFMILAYTNVGNTYDKDLSVAWQSKAEQAYQKALLIFENENELSQIQNTYSQVCTKLTKQRKIESIKRARNILAELTPILPNLIIVIGWLISIFVLFYLVNLDNNDMAFILLLDFITGAILIPFTFRCSSPLPKIITAFGIILSIVVLISLCGENPNNAGNNDFAFILVIDIICSIIIFIRMFKKRTRTK